MLVSFGKEQAKSGLAHVLRNTPGEAIRYWASIPDRVEALTLSSFICHLIWKTGQSQYILSLGTELLCLGMEM